MLWAGESWAGGSLTTTAWAGAGQNGRPARRYRATRHPEEFSGKFKGLEFSVGV